MASADFGVAAGSWTRRGIWAPAAAVAVAVGLALLGATACGSTPAKGPASAWAEGPVRWLMLPKERRQCQRLQGRREAVLFIELFWRRRDPTPSDPGNPFLQTFHDRVQAADQLYSEDGVRGALTDRGRALILLGPPPVLRQRVRTVVPATTGDPQLGVGTRPAPPPEPRSSILKDWQYGPEALDPLLLDLLDEEQRHAGIVLTFVEKPDGVDLLAGERLLELAAKALASQPLR